MLSQFSPIMWKTKFILFAIQGCHDLKDFRADNLVVETLQMGAQNVRVLTFLVGE